MAVEFYIVHNGVQAKVTPSGELVVAPLAYSDSQFNELGANDTAFNFYGPKPNQQLVITGIRARADRDVATATDAIVIIYEADSSSSLTVDKVLHQENMVRGEEFTLTTRQADFIAILHRAHQTGDPWVHKLHLFNKLEVGASTIRPRDIFKSRQKAWKILVRNDRKGKYCLN